MTGLDINLKNVQRKITVTSFLIVLWIFINFFTLSIMQPNIGLGVKVFISYHILLSLTFIQLWYFSYSAVFNAAAQYEKNLIEVLMFNAIFFLIVCSQFKSKYIIYRNNAYLSRCCWLNIRMLCCHFSSVQKI